MTIFFLEKNHIRLTISPSVTINTLDSSKSCGNYDLCKTQNETKKTSKVRDFLKEIKIEKKILRSMGYSEISISRKLLTVNIFVKTKNI